MFVSFAHSLPFSLSISYLPSLTFSIPCHWANTLIIYKLLRLSWNRWQIPTGFNHSSVNEISMVNAHGSSLLLYCFTSIPTGAPHGRMVSRMCKSIAWWPNCPGSTWASPQGTRGEGNNPGEMGNKRELAKRGDLPDEIWLMTSVSMCVCGCGTESWGVFGSLPQPLPVFEQPW